MESRDGMFIPSLKKKIFRPAPRTPKPSAYFDSRKATVRLKTGRLAGW